MKLVAAGRISQEDAIGHLRKSCDPGTQDNLYHDLKKNHYNYMNHLKLWDVNFYITRLGKTLLDYGGQHDPKKRAFREKLAQITLVQGRHAELIEDIEKCLSESRPKPASSSEARKIMYDYFEAKGFIKKNPNRASSGTREFLASEFDLWNKFGLVEREGLSYFVAREGFKFNLSLIERLVNTAPENFDE